MTPKKDGNIVKILGIELISTSTSSVLGLIEGRISQNKKTFVVTPNPEFMVYAHDHPWFKRILIQSDIAIPDGIGLIWASRFWGRGVIKERVSGTDLMEKLCQMAAKKGWTVYFLGGKPGVAVKTLSTLQKKYVGLRGWAAAGPKLELRMDNGEDTSDGGRPSLRGHDSSEVKKWVDQINRRHPDLLFVAFGMGKQEKFIYDNWNQLKIKLGMGIGGAFNYLSGEVKRPPQWLQNMGFEWLYRLMKEPWRWKRQLSLGKFIWFCFASPKAIKQPPCGSGDHHES